MRLAAATASASTSPNSNTAAVNGILFFRGTDGQLWRSDGSASGTRRVTTAAGSVTALTNINGTLYFIGSTSSTGLEVWRSDGTESGTYLLKDVNPGPASSSPQMFTAAGGTVYFRANDGAHGPELWRSDGTAAGTRLVADVTPGTSGAPPMNSLMGVGDTVYFTIGGRLWRSDGTAQGTVDLAASALMGPSPTPALMAGAGGLLFFRGADSRLWRTDGTAAGTRLVTTAATNVTTFAEVNGTLYFVATDGQRGAELWRSDGSAAGTGMLVDLNEGVSSSSPSLLTYSGGQLYFEAAESSFLSLTRLLWVYTPPNIAPRIDALTLAPATPRVRDVVSATVSARDPDADDTLTYAYRWFRGGVPLAGQSSSTLDLGSLSGLTHGELITVTVTVTDGHGASDSESASVAVDARNRAPAGAGGTATLDEDAAYTLGVADFGFSDPDDAPANGLSAVVITTPPIAGVLMLGGVPVAAGQAVDVADLLAGRLVFTPAANANGVGYASLTFQVRDDGGTAAGGIDLDPTPDTLTLDVRPVNDAPVAAADAYAADEDASASGDVLANDFDVDGDGLTASLVSGPSHGTLVLNADGTFTYTPVANFNGSDSFSYRPFDGQTYGEAVSVSLSIAPINDAPVAEKDVAVVAQDTPTIVDVLGNDRDIDGDAPAVIDHAQPAHGSLVLNADGTFTYTPATGYSGTDGFTYTAGDGQGGNSTATVHLTVSPAATGSAYLRPDPLNAGRKMLIVNGTGGDDRIRFEPAGAAGQVLVTLNGHSVGTFAVDGRILAYGLGGDDDIQAAGSISQPTWFYVDTGNDRLNLANGGGVAFGGDGDDRLLGGAGRDVLVGGQGADSIVANAGDDILVAGYTSYDDRLARPEHEDAYGAILAEWSRQDATFAQRVDRLAGRASGGINAGYVFSEATLHDDDATDAIDALTGSAGEDWFLWQRGEDQVNGMSAAESGKDVEGL